MGVISIIGRVVIVIVNILIVLLSLAMIAVGTIILVGKDIYKDLLDKFEEQLQESFTSMGLTVNTDDLSLTDFLEPVAIALIVIGIILGALAMLGCIGACCTIKVVLVVYVIVLLVLFLAQAIVAIIVYANKDLFDDTIKPHIKDTLKDYTGIEGTDAVTLGWNALMNYEKCCGVSDYTDFSVATDWDKTINNVPYNLETPVICCKVKSIDYTCATAPTDDISYWKTGCYDKLMDYVLENVLVIIVVACMLGLQFVLIFFTIWILCTINNKVDVI